MGNKIDRELVEILETPVDIKKLVDKLFFAPDALERAALSQPKYQFEVGRLRTQMYLNKSSLRRKLSRLNGKKGLKLRQKHDLKTEGAVKERLTLDPEIREAQRAYDRAEAYDLAIEDLREAYKERNMVIGFITKLRTAEMMATLGRVRGEEATEKLRKRADSVRKKFKELDEDVDY